MVILFLFFFTVTESLEVLYNFKMVISGQEKLWNNIWKSKYRWYFIS